MLKSNRFNLDIHITKHASQRMSERNISIDLIIDLVETGKTKYKDETRLWISKSYPHRNDNLICAAVVLENVLVIKTVMHNWKLMEA
jgi:hypothetical protein